MEKKQIYMALAKAQANFKKAVKDSRVKFEAKKEGGASANYTYADLSSIWDCIHEPLAENNLFISHQTYHSEGKLMMKTLIYDSYGDSIETNLPVINGDTKDPKAFGSALTYTRRYSICCLLCVITEDDDATEAQNDYNKKRAEKQSNAPVQASSNSGASDKQIELIKRLVNGKYFTENQRAKVLADVNNMNSSDASKMIERLNKAIEERKTAIDTLESALTLQLWKPEEIQDFVNQILKAKNEEERRGAISIAIDINARREDAMQGQKHFEKNDQ